MGPKCTSVRWAMVIALLIARLSSGFAAACQITAVG
jgi:hypothetical protein